MPAATPPPDGVPPDSSPGTAPAARTVQTADTAPTARAPRARRSGTRRLVLWLCGLFALAMILGGTWSLINRFGRTTDRQELTVTPVGNQLTVRTAGDVRLRRGTGTEVQITGRISYGVGKPKIVTASTAAGVSLGSDCPWYSWECTTDFDIAVPAGVSVDVHTSAGDITVADLDTPVRLDSSAGDIVATGLTADQVDVDTSAGDIDLTFTEPPRTVRVHSSAGDVDLRLPDVDGSYHVEGGSGAGDRDVRISTNPDSERTIKVDTSAGDVSIERS